MFSTKKRTYKQHYNEKDSFYKYSSPKFTKQQVLLENLNTDICIVGGLGHIGLPLGIVFASKGLKVCLQDINKDSAEIVSRGELTPTSSVLDTIEEKAEDTPAIPENNN